MAAANEFTGKKLQTGIPSKEFEENWDRLLANNPRSFPEDFELENGKYQCRCSSCRKLFIGLKGRMFCKECN